MVFLFLAACGGWEGALSGAATGALGIGGSDAPSIESQIGKENADDLSIKGDGAQQALIAIRSPGKRDIQAEIVTINQSPAWVPYVIVAAFFIPFVLWALFSRSPIDKMKMKRRGYL